jgi:small GTP-binding protein
MYSGSLASQAWHTVSVRTQAAFLDTVMSQHKPEEQRGARSERKLRRGVRLARTLEGHEMAVFSVAFESAGQILASGSGDNTVKLWEVASGKLLRTLEGHKKFVNSVMFDPTGQTLASGSGDSTVKLWEVASGKLLHALEGHKGTVLSIAFDPTGRTLASGGSDHTIRLWEVVSGKLLHTFEGYKNSVRSVAFDPTGQTLAGGSDDKTIKLWEVASGNLLHNLQGHEDSARSVVFDPMGQTLASGSGDKTIKLWEVVSGKLLLTLEGHTSLVDAVVFSIDGKLLASKSADRTLRLWSCENWEMLSVIPEPTNPGWWIPGLAFHPTLPMLASVGSEPDASDNEAFRLIHLWELDFDVLFGKSPEAKPVMKAVHHTTAKIVLVGDHSVGKSGLGWRLAHGEFKEQSSTHGQQFWVLPQLGKLRDDGTECEAILWDLAGQPDYRLIHALFLDDVDLALVLFDSSNLSDPLHGVEFWLKQLKAGQARRLSDSSDQPTGCPTILVGAQADRGTPTLTLEDLEAFCQARGISGYLSTSAKAGWNIEELLQRMKELIPWEGKAATVTTVTFKRIKDYVLRLKEGDAARAVIVTLPGLRRQLEQTDADWQFTDAEMMTAVGHLENYGYVKRLRTSQGEERILLAPELLNNLAASFVLEARRNVKGLGALEERRLLAGEYAFPELEKLPTEERDILLDAAALLFLEHNVCFREIDPLGGKSYLVFPELINLKKPLLENEPPTEESVAYSVSGAVENVYASLVVLLGYTQTFTRTDQWQNQARYVMADGSICGFRQENNQAGELELVLYFGANVPRAGQKVFEGLFESFLARRNLTVFRYEPVNCPNGHRINRAVVREQLRDEEEFAFCAKCGGRAVLPKADEPIQLTQSEQRKVEEQRWIAAQRTRFEQAVFQLASYVESQKLDRPECFISYAWGDREQERWVERNLATDLHKAGLSVVLDRWSTRVGMSVPRFIDRIEKCDRVIVVGTPLYRTKYENKDTTLGFVVAAEVDLISGRMLGTEAEKETVMPLLLAGEEKTALPPLLQRRVYADFRNERAYFITAFDLILSLYGIAPNNPAVADLRELLQDERGMR